MICVSSLDTHRAVVEEGLNHRRHGDLGHG
jgi:hypothetical protein